VKSLGAARKKTWYSCQTSRER